MSIEDIINQKCRNTRIMTHTDSMVVYYPWFSDMAKQVNDTFWPGDEYPVQDDLNDFLVNLSESELHGITTALKLFSLYEIKIGNDYWANYIIPNFPRPELTRVSAAICNVENNSHAIFYDLINQVLGLSSDEFYDSYLQDATLAARAKSIGTFIKHKIPLVSLAAFSMLEGAVLYATFGYIKSYSTNGMSKLKNTGSGISASVTDELGHCLVGAELYKTLLEEANLTQDELKYVQDEIIKVATLICDHEFKIIDMIFEKGEHAHITSKDCKAFTMSRINECLANINITPLFTNIKSNPIATWFYDNVNTFQSIDFFQTQGKEYVRGWAKNKFIW